MYKFFVIAIILLFTSCQGNQNLSEIEKQKKSSLKVTIDEVDAKID